jgi:O-acetyl-ADP-ribose deacetylase (regulator of RNase III)
VIAREIKGDIFASSAQTLVCPVNTVGAMGAGLALAFKHRFPGLEDAYQMACYKDVFKREGILIYNVTDNTHVIRKILCMPTKRHWRLRSKLEWIDEALQIIAKDYKACGIESLAIPAVGCGNGKLDWHNVYNLIHMRLGPIPLPVDIYLPWDSDPTDYPPDAAVRGEI